MKKSHLIIIACVLYFATGAFFLVPHLIKQGGEAENPGRELGAKEQAVEEAVMPQAEDISEAEEAGDEEEAPEVLEEGFQAALNPEEADEPEPLEKYRELLEVNPYVSGWLAIDQTPIDAPVVYTPGSQNYFLHHSIDGTPMESGTLFIAVPWREDCHNTLIYGHNMKSGSGFGSLLNYADPSYGMGHSVIRFDTLYEEQEYDLVAAFYSQIYAEEELESDEDRAEKDELIVAESRARKEEEIKQQQEQQQEQQQAEQQPSDPEPEETPVQEEIVLTLRDLDLFYDFGNLDIYRQQKDEDNGRFRYYYYTDLSDPEDFAYYASKVKENALYETGQDITWGDELLTLSTCSYQVANGRFVVVAKKRK